MQTFKIYNIQIIIKINKEIMGCDQSKPIQIQQPIKVSKYDNQIHKTNNDYVQLNYNSNYLKIIDKDAYKILGNSVNTNSNQLGNMEKDMEIGIDGQIQDKANTGYLKNIYDINQSKTNNKQNNKYHEKQAILQSFQYYCTHNSMYTKQIDVILKSFKIYFQHNPTSKYSEQQQKYKTQAQQLQQLLETVSRYSFINQDTMFILSLYLVRICRMMYEKGIMIGQINENIQTIIRNLNIKYMQTINCHVQDNIKFIYFAIGDEQYHKIQSKVFKEQQQYLQFTPQTSTKEKLQQNNKNRHKQKQLQDKIQAIVNQCKSYQPYFRQLLQPICKNNQGYNYVDNLKLQSIDDKQKLQRIKQKIISHNKYKHLPLKNTNFNFKTIHELMHNQQIYKNTYLNNLFNQSNKIKIVVSDILRGRCYFKYLQNVNKAGQQIIQKIANLKKQNNKVEIIAIENRLKQFTDDLVFKIRIGNIVSQLQLIIYDINYSNLGNKIYHKMYQLTRSKFNTALVMLFKWHQKLSKSYLTKLGKVLVDYLKKYGVDNKQYNFFVELCTISQIDPKIIQSYIFQLQKNLTDKNTKNS